jgi:Ca-activated chloride channel homolog
MLNNQFIRYCIGFIFLSVTTFTAAAGLLKPVNSSLPDLQIREHHVNVVIDNGYVTTVVEQVFHNPNDAVLEAIYSFPIPESAAVGEFTYWVNGQPVIAEVVEKKKAREIYETEKQAGRATALVEQDSFKTFEIHVFPVQPASDVRIRLVYLQAAKLDTGIGRYVYPLEEGGVDEEKNAFWTRNEVVTEKFSFNLDFRSSYPIDALRLPKHPAANVKQLSAEDWQVNLINEKNIEDANATNVISLNQDIVVYWRQVEGLPGSVDLLTFKEETEDRGTFMLTLNPGEDLAAITQGSDWVFVLDVSGSMEGKYATLVEGVKQGLKKLRTDDRFRVVLFNDNAKDMTNGFKTVSPESINDVLQELDQYQVGGGTNLYSGLVEGITQLNADRPSGIILVTDGVANVGVTEKKDFLRLLEKYDVRLFTFIMGNSADRPLLQEMAKVSKGFAMSISNADDIVGQIIIASGKLTHQAYRDIQLDINGVRVKDISPEAIGSLYRGEQLTIFGHYWQGGTADIVLSATLGNQQKQYRSKIEFPKVDTRNPELERLWAFGAIENLQAKLDYFGDDADVKNAITDIAVEYGLVTDYTSMIVVEEEIFKQLNIDRSNKNRVEREQQARLDRQSQAVQQNRADINTPMFSGNRPTTTSSGGGGAINPVWILLLLVLGFVRTKNRNS